MEEIKELVKLLKEEDYYEARNQLSLIEQIIADKHKNNIGKLRNEIFINYDARIYGYNIDREEQVNAMRETYLSFVRAVIGDPHIVKVTWSNQKNLDLVTDKNTILIDYDLYGNIITFSRFREQFLEHYKDLLIDKKIIYSISGKRTLFTNHFEKFPKSIVVQYEPYSQMRYNYSTHTTSSMIKNISITKHFSEFSKHKTIYSEDELLSSIRQSKIDNFLYD